MRGGFLIDFEVFAAIGCVLLLVSDAIGCIAAGVSSVLVFVRR